jgi:hypothetical protein
MRETPVECDFEESTAARYVAGRMAEAEALAFEAHWFDCDRCWREVRAAQELRSALVPPTVARAARPRPWLPLAAAAALVLALGGLGLLRRTGDGKVFRAPKGGELALTASVGEAAVGVSWSPVPRARGYRARLVTADGALLAARELQAPPLSLDRAGLPEGTLYLTVQALGADGQLLASSAPLELPPRGPAPR